MLPLGLFRLSSLVLLLGLLIGVLAPGAAARVLNAGLVLLMAVPLSRVLVLLAIYAWRRDWLSAAATAGVLAVVVLTLVVAWI